MICVFRGASPTTASFARGPVLTIPNLITSIRLVAGPVCLWLLLAGEIWALWVALAVMIIAELSDMFDGMVARALGQVSNLGKLLDPLSDSLYRVAVFVGLVAAGLMPAWMLVLILVRDLVVAHVRVVAGARGVAMAARTSGKIKAIVQAVAQLGVVLLAAAFADTSWAGDLGWALLLVATLVTAWSMADYAGAVAGGALTWPVAVSLGRVLLGVAAAILLSVGAGWAAQAALACLLAAIVGDLFDGTLPQRLGHSGQIPAFIDHAADTVIFGAVFVGLLAAAWVGAWPVLIVAAAEVTVPYLRNIGGQGERALEIAWPERMRTAAYAAGLLVLVAAGSGVVDMSVDVALVGWVFAAVAAVFWLGTLMDCLRTRAA